MRTVWYFLCGSAYQIIVKPIFFLIQPETIHDFFLAFGHAMGENKYARAAVSFFFNFEHPMLAQSVAGISFRNPVGLSEGYDKDAKLLAMLPSVGFGFTQVGTLTLHPYEGNPKPRLTRLPRSKAILVNYGLKNDGVSVVMRRIKSYGATALPIGISIGKTNSCDTVDVAEGIADYVDCLKQVIESELGDFYTINISCPNTFGGEPFTTPEKLEQLLAAFMPLVGQKPVFLKMPINLLWEDFHALCAIAVSRGVTGVIIGNLNKNFSDPLVKDVIAQGAKGGISGKPTEYLCNELITRTYAAFQDRLIIIGVGGIFSAADAYEKIRRGAHLVQLITGLIFGGPQIVAAVNAGLVQYLKRDGYASIHEAVGAYHRNRSTHH